MAASGGRLAAVGYVGLRGIWTAIGWTSTDAERWTLTTIDTTPASLAVAIAAVPETGGFMAGGRVERAVGGVGAPDNYIPTIWLTAEP